MNAQSKILFLLFVVIGCISMVVPVNAGPAESNKARKADLEAQSAEIKTEAAVAMDISLNALSNVIATFNDTEKTITTKLQAGDISDVKSMVKLLGEAWDSEKKVLKEIEKIATYVSVVTSALKNAEMQLKITQTSKANIKRADKEMILARKNVNKASGIAEKLKQDWLLPIVTTETSKKK